MLRRTEDHDVGRSVGFSDVVDSDTSVNSLIVLVHRSERHAARVQVHSDTSNVSWNPRRVVLSHTTARSR